jgi:tetratricopeptide (TPR) repeat protein
MNSPRLEKLFEFLKKAPNDVFTLYSIAYEYMNRGEQESAKDYFNQLLKVDPQYVGAYYHLGKTWEKLQQPEEAAAVYLRGIAVAQKKPDFHALAELNSARNALLGLDYDDDV